MGNGHTYSAGRLSRKILVHCQSALSTGDRVGDGVTV